MKYKVDINLYVGPEDMGAGRTREVVHTQAWQDGRWLPAVASLCTEEGAKHLCKLLNDECEALALLRKLVSVSNSRGQYTVSGSDFHTEEARAYWAAVDFLNR